MISTTRLTKAIASAQDVINSMIDESENLEVNPKLVQLRSILDEISENFATLEQKELSEKIYRRVLDVIDIAIKIFGVSQL